MRTYLSILTSILLSCQPAFAQVELKQGQPAPIDGWLFSVEQERDLRYRLSGVDHLEAQLALQLKQTENYKSLADLNFQLATNYQAALKSESDTISTLVKRNESTKWLYLCLGIGLTLVSGFAITYSAKGIK